MTRKTWLILIVLGLIVIFREPLTEKVHALGVEFGIIETSMVETGQITNKQVVPHSSTRIDNLIEVNGKRFNFPKEQFDRVEVGNTVTITYTEDTIEKVDILQ